MCVYNYCCSLTLTVAASHIGYLIELTPPSLKSFNYSGVVVQLYKRIKKTHCLIINYSLNQINQYVID